MGACTTKSRAKASCMGARKSQGVDMGKFVFALRSRSSTMLRFDTKIGEMEEREFRDIPEFQEGQMSCLCASQELLCVGGAADGFCSLLVDDLHSTWRKLRSPPKPIAYGQMHALDSDAFVFGALDLSLEHQNGDVCAPLLYSLKGDSWRSLPAPPEPLALYGSALSPTCALIFGGFLDHPDYSYPNDAVFSYSLGKSVWSKLPLHGPLAISLPRCVFIDTAAVLVIGGHDPLDRFPESNQAYLFTNGDFRPLESIPNIGKLRFCDTPVRVRDCVYVFSEDETMFKYYLSSNIWEYVDFSVQNDIESVPTARPSFSQCGDSLFRYERKTSEFLEYVTSAGRSRKISPSVYRVFPKWPGIMITADGEVVVAGGVRTGKGSVKEDVDSVWLFNPISRMTIDLPSLPERQHGLRLVQFSSKVYAVAGICTQVPVWKSFLQVSDSIETGWTALVSMPYATAFPGVAIYLEGIYCIAGESQTEYCSQFNLIQVYSLKENQWRVLTTEYPLGLAKIGVCREDTGLVCFGGQFEDKSSSTTAYQLEANGEFRRLAEIPNIRGYGGAIQNPAIRCGQSVFAFAKDGPVLRYRLGEDLWEVIEV